jgi:Coenzyme PQQ synthesis protein D (PqqD)
VEEIRPLARTEGLLAEEVDGELLVYDGEREVACRLNGTAALVWRSSDGERTVADLVAVLSEELGEVADEDMVMVALDTLAEHGLIEAGHEAREVNASRLSRRRFLRRVGVVGAAAISLPVVHSIVVPTPAAAASGGYTPYYTRNRSLFAR